MYAVRRIRILVETKPAYKAAMQRVMARYKKNLDERLGLPIAVK